MNCDMVLITERDYPYIFKAFELISHDTGNQAGHKNYAISMKWESKLSDMDGRFKYMWDNADSDFECLCIGEEFERQRIVRDYKFQDEDKLLQEFFEELS